MNRQCPKCGSVVVDGLNFCPSCGAPVVPEVVAPVVPEVPVIPTEPVAPVMPEPTVNVQQDVMGIPAVGPVPTMNPDAAPGTGVTVDSLLSTNAEVEAKKEAANAETNAGTNNDNPYTPGIGNIPSRSVMSALVFSFLTCGIYSIYWFVKLTEEANAVSGETKPSGGTAFLLSLITCGIYTYFWMYKQGGKIYQGGVNKNVPIENRGVLYIILTVFGLGIVNYCLMQSDLNKIAKAN